MTRLYVAHLFCWFSSCLFLSDVLTAVNQSQRSSLKGTLHLVDLAGSERLSRSNVTGDRLKETVAINKSLSSLTDVFVSISNKNSHVRSTARLSLTFNTQLLAAGVLWGGRG